MNWMIFQHKTGLISNILFLCHEKLWLPPQKQWEANYSLTNTIHQGWSVFKLDPDILAPLSWSHLTSLHLRGQSQECADLDPCDQIHFHSSQISMPGEFHFQTKAFGWFFNLPIMWNVSASSGCRIFNCDHQLENILEILLAFHLKVKSFRYPGILIIHHQKKLDIKVLQITKLSLHHVIQSSSDSECSQQCHDPETHQRKKKVKL